MTTPWKSFTGPHGQPGLYNQQTGQVSYLLPVQLSWDEAKHPRGHAGNKGEFAAKGQGGKPESTKEKNDRIAHLLFDEWQNGEEAFHVGGPFWARLYNGKQVTIEMKPFDGNLHLAFIGTEGKARGKGLASKALKEITDLADKHGLTITASVSPQKGSGLNEAALHKWYARNGFKRENYDDGTPSDEIIRKPKSELSFNESEHPRGQPGNKGEFTGKDQYLNDAVRNLKATSRTAGGHGVDTSATAGKAENIVHGLTAEDAKDAAVDNFKRIMSGLYHARKTDFKSPDKVMHFADSINHVLGKGIVKDGVLEREEDSAKFPYTKVADLPAARKQFGEEFFQRLKDGKDPVETAAWVEWRANLTDHFWADGCGKTAQALASWVLMKNDLPLPKAQDRAEMFKHAAKTRFKAGDGDSYLGAEWQDWLKYYRGLFDKQLAHAPKGGIAIAGKQFKGGEFIPKDVLAQATPEERHALGVHVAKEIEEAHLSPENKEYVNVIHNLVDEAVEKDGKDLKAQVASAYINLGVPKDAANEYVSHLASIKIFDHANAVSLASGDRLKRFAQTFKEVLAKISTFPGQSLKRISENLRQVVFYNDIFSLTTDVTSDPATIMNGDMIGGAWRNKRQTSYGVMVLDGGKDIGEVYPLDEHGEPVMTLHKGDNTYNQDTHQIYAHELTHVIDGGEIFSGTPEWKAAWEKELKSQKLTAYAASRPSEGFAEFGRAIFLNDPGDDPENPKRPAIKSLKKEFPECWKYWQEKVLV